MARDLWLTRREAIKIDKIKKSLSISAASYSTFRRLACLEYVATDANDNKCATPSLPANTFTIELWVKPLSAAVTKQVIYKFGDVTPQIELSLTGNTLLIRIWKGGVPTSITYTTPIAFNWTHIAFTYDNVTGRLFLNGSQVVTGALAGALDSGSLFFHIAQSAPTTEMFIGRIGELRIWSLTRTAEQIFQSYQNPRLAGGGDVTGLVHYYKCNGVTLDLTGNENDQIVNQSINASNSKFTTDDAPPLIFGGSFVAAEFAVSGLGYPLSFQFPNTPPDGTTGMLVVRWLDEDGLIQRRRFWDLGGVDIQPIPETYNGEAVAEDFVLEWWNIDGASTLVVPEDITLHLSKSTMPTTGTDQTPVEAATMTEDITLGEAFPLTFPLTFNQAQGYN